MPSVSWVAHLYTALGAALALAATLAVFESRFRAAFLLLAIATFIDCTDGWLARALRVKERLPSFDGARLDDIVDYLTYVFVPVLVVLRAGLLPPAWGVWVGTAVLLASAYGFAQSASKVHTTDYFFTGFPSYWNIVALYLFVGGLPQAVNAGVLLGLALLVFVPIRFVYPSRTMAWRGVTLALGVVWGVLVMAMVWRLPATDGPWTLLSLVFPVYYTVLSAWLHTASSSQRAPDSRPSGGDRG